MDNAPSEDVITQMDRLQKQLTELQDALNMRPEERSRKRTKKRGRRRTDERNRKRTEELKRERAEERNRKSIQPIGDLNKEGDFLIWRDSLINALRRADFHDHILEGVPKPADRTERRKWEQDRAAIDEYIRKTVPDRAVWAILEGMDWDITERDPKSTFDKLTQYFNEDTHEVNYLLCRELFTIKREDYDRFSTFQHRLNYLRQRLGQSKSWKLTEDAATMCALNAVDTAHPEFYSQTMMNTGNTGLSWSGLMSEFSILATH